MLFKVFSITVSISLMFFISLKNLETLKSDSKSSFYNEKSLPLLKFELRNRFQPISLFPESVVKEVLPI